MRDAADAVGEDEDGDEEMRTARGKQQSLRPSARTRTARRTCAQRERADGEGERGGDGSGLGARYVQTSRPGRDAISRRRESRVRSMARLPTSFHRTIP